MMLFWTSGYAIEKNESASESEIPTEINPVIKNKNTKPPQQKTHYGMGYEQRMKRYEAGRRRIDINRLERPRRPDRPSRPGR